MHNPSNDTQDASAASDKAELITDHHAQDAQGSLAADNILISAQQMEEERLKAFAHLMDSAIRLPGGFRIGLDGLLGLIPGIGDLLGALLSGYFIYGASKLNIPRYVIVRMLINTLIETIIGVVPFVGDAFDFIFRANDRNARLLRAALQERDEREAKINEQHDNITRG